MKQTESKHRVYILRLAGYDKIGGWYSLPWVLHEVRLPLPDTVPSGWMEPGSVNLPFGKNSEKESEK